MASWFVTELEALAGRVERHAQLELLRHDVRPGLDDAMIAEVERRFGASLPEPVRDLYRSTAGASMRWRVRPDLDGLARERRLEEFRVLGDDPETIFDVAGSVELVPLDVLLFDDELALPQLEEPGEFDFEGEPLTANAFAALLRPFDVFDEYFAMAFVVQRERPVWKLMLVTDYWIEFSHSRVTWLDDYLHFVIATWGIVMARDVLFGEYRGDREPPLTFDPARAERLVPASLRDAA